MKEEKDRSQDQEKVNEESRDVKCNEAKDPYKYKHQRKSKKDEAHPLPPTPTTP
jgi:hypothetical protein